MDGKSLNITQELLDQIQNILPEVFSEGKIDWERLRLALGDELAHPKDHYELSWAGKAEARKEIQKQTTATLIPERDKSIHFDTTQNLFIEGENLEVLRALQRSYFGKVKMIYIDPPYNTGSDSFVYPDDYAERLKEYKERAGMVDENGYLNKQDLWKTNRKENGHFHSVWLSMMYPRLYLARNLLREDGVIFVSIDDNEQANLKLLMDEVFGRDNFVANFIWEKKFSPQNDATWISDVHDYIFLYAKDKQIWRPTLLPRTQESINRYSNPDNDPRGVWASTDMTVKRLTEKDLYPITTPSGKVIYPTKGRSWILSKEKYEQLLNENKIWFGESGNNTPRVKKFLSEVNEGIVPTTLLKFTQVGHNQEARQEIKSLFDENSYFDTPKPSKLIKHLLNIGSGTDSLILDFFAGSGTTGQAVMELNAEDGGNRRFILVQYPEPTDDNSEAKKAGYHTIADITRARLIKVIDRLKTKQAEQLPMNEGEALDLGFKAFRLAESNFKQWRGDLSGKEAIFKQLDFYKADLVKTEATTETVLHELILKNGLPLTVTPEERVSGDGRFYHVADYGLCFCLEGFEWDALSKVKALKPRKVLVLNEVMERSGDVFLSNAHLELADAGIELELVK